VNIAVLVAAGFSTHLAWVWWSIAVGVVVWLPLDTARSIYHRVYVNAAAVEPRGPLGMRYARLAPSETGMLAG
jgi:hypothetical protein